MLLYRIGPEGFYAAAEDAAAAADGGLRVLHSDPFTTAPGGWELGRAVDPGSAALLAPVNPGKIIGIGRNYLEHARELGNDLPAEPVLFLKAISALLGPKGTVVLPPESGRVEHEGEIAVVLRDRLTRGATREEARAAVLGVTCVDDVTARDLQKSDSTFERSKGFDTFCPLGPAIWVGADLASLEVVTRVNGEERQHGRTRDMAWGIVDLLVYAARMMTLEPGDLVLTGSPPGVGPLRDGDRVEVEIPGLGVLEHGVETLRTA
jgi:2-keto-4-pentenoate hydratase/2-oxohepta-3-ene-1,7-dioic acid hydratase in catechol pathway